jgi:hypothetical protein
MGAKGCLGSVGLVAFLLGTAGCGGPAQTAPKEAAPAASQEAKPKKEEVAEEIPKEAIESGKDCAKAEAQCGGGVCALSLDNTCAAAVTCDIHILTVCQAQTDIVQAKARKRETFAAGKKDRVSIAADCAENRIISTKVQTLSCK